MRKDLITVLGMTALLVSTMSVLAITFHVNVGILTAASLSMYLWIGVLLYRRSRHAAPEVPATSPRSLPCWSAPAP